MPGLEVHCGSCGGIFTVTEDMAGLIATCPKCERQVSVPLPDSVRQSRPKLQVKREGTLDGGKRCPHCGGSMVADAVICVQCGYDLRTGRAFTEAAPVLRQMKPLLTVLGLVILAGITWSVMRSRSGSGIMGDPPPQVPPAPQSAQDVTAPEPVVTPVPAPVAAEQVSQPAVAPAPAGDQQEAIPEPQPPTESPEEMRARLTRNLNDRYPMFTPGAAVAIRRLNGLVHRGELIVLGAESVALKADNQVMEVPYSVLDRASRLRCDAGFRKTLVELKMKQAGSSAENF